MQFLAESAGWVFGWLLRNSAHAAFLGGVVWILELTLLRRLPPRWRYLLWWVVLARLLLPIAPESRLSVFNLIDLAPQGLAEFAGQLLGLPAPVVLPNLEPANPLTDTPSWFVWALALWLPGACVLAYLVGRDHVRLRSALEHTVPTTDPMIQGLLLQCRAVMKVRRNVEVVETTSITSPAITGWWRARVLLPAGLLPRLTRDEARYLILHELAHVKRADLVLNWLLAAVQVLHWFNPVVWLAIRRLLAVREEVCDELVLHRCFAGAHREYGLTLLRVLEECAPRRIVPTLAGVLDDLSALRQRMRCIRNFGTPVGNPWTPAFLTVVIAVMGLTERHVDPSRIYSAPLNSPSSRSVRHGVRPPPGRGPLPRLAARNSAPPPAKVSESASGEPLVAVTSREKRTSAASHFLAAFSAALADWGFGGATQVAPPTPVSPPEATRSLAQRPPPDRRSAPASSPVARPPAIALGSTQPGSNPVRMPSSQPSRPTTAAASAAAQPIPVVRVGHPSESSSEPDSVANPED